MKKILLASTALAFSAGMASAQVAVGGYGFMGITNNAAGTTVNHGARLTFTGTVQADHGVTFTMFARQTISAGGNTGSVFALSPAAPNAVANNATFDRLRVDVSAMGLTLSVGNTNGAVRTLARTAYYYGYNDGGIYGADTGSTGTGFQTDGQQNVTARYNYDAFSVAVSAPIAGGSAEIAARYSASGITVAAGVNTAAGNPYALHASYNGGDWTIGAGYASLNNRFVVGGSYNFDAFTIGAAVQSTGGATDYGLNVGYNLGGGATLSATVAVNAAGATTVGAGAFFSF